jgi:hypothetical protein
MSLYFPSASLYHGRQSKASRRFAPTVLKTLITAAPLTTLGRAERLPVKVYTTADGLHAIRF